MSLKLTNFRNYPSVFFEFGKKAVSSDDGKQITVLRGNNAQGKTNFLESIYFLATAKSPRADRDEELILAGQEVVRVEGDIKNRLSGDEEEVHLEVVMQSVNGHLTKRVKVNGIPRRVSDYSENFAVVLFRPEDINLVSGSPSLRRDFIDSAISQVDKSYKRTISTYENLLVRKNRLLKRIREGFAKRGELEYWTDQQVLLGAVVQEKRRELFEFLNVVERKFGDSRFKYLQNAITSERLQEYQIREIESASSLIGPHRDDFVFLMGERDLSKFGSRGEQRTAVLDLKISEAEFIDSKMGGRPVLLLDDIFSELDVDHRKHVIDLAAIQQTIIATVDWDDNLEKALKGARVLNVESGKIS